MKFYQFLPVSKGMALVTLFFSFTSYAMAQDAGWELNTRMAPPPAGASDRLRDSITATPKPNIPFRKAVTPKDDEAWKSLIGDQDEARTVSLITLEQEFGLTIDPDSIGGVRVFRITPDDVAPEHERHMFLHFHGGAYVFGGGENAVPEGAMIAAAAGIPTISVDYRMPPDHPFPAAIDDTIRVYRQILTERPAKSIAIGGTSAGGGLALAAVHQMIALGLEIPGAVYAGTPWADLTKTGDTLFTLEGLDRSLVTYDGLLAAAGKLYAGEYDLKNPLISPVYGDFEGFPPTCLVTGTRDLFLSDTARTHFKLRSAGVSADLIVIEGLSHAGYLLDHETPEAQFVMSELGRFFAAHLSSP